LLHSGELPVNDLPQVTRRSDGAGCRRGAGGIGQGDHDHTSVFGRDQDISVTEPVQDDSFQRGDRGSYRWEPLARLAESDLVSASQIQAERFPALDELTEVGIAAEQVFNEFSSLCLLATNHLATGLGMALGKGCDRVVNDLQDRHRRGADRRSVAVTDFRRKFTPHVAGC
jgi:hypothetical protein